MASITNFVWPSPSTVVPLTAIFTPPASCSTHFTYEPAEYNSVANGMLIQDAIDILPDTDCFPPGFVPSGRDIENVFSPGWCPIGYVTTTLQALGDTTSAICCQSGYDLAFQLSDSLGSSTTTTATFIGCISNFPSGSITTVPGKTGYLDTTTTTVTGPMTMWAQPIIIAFQDANLSYFTSGMTGAIDSAAPSTIATVDKSGSAAAATTETPLGSGTAQTSSPSSSATTPASSSNSSISGGALAGIIVGAIAGSLILIAALLWFGFRHRKRRIWQHAEVEGDAPLSRGNFEEHNSKVAEMDVVDATRSRRPVEIDSTRWK